MWWTTGSNSGSARPSISSTRPPETFGVALGYPNFILATHDAGATWDMLNSPVSGDDASLNAASFIDENIGFLATGYEPTDKSAPATPEEIRHRTLMRISPLYRFVHDGGMKSAKAVRKEGIYKTTDGGQTWVELVADMVWLPYRLSMANEQYGAVLTNEASGHSNYGIRYTDDGGATWNAGTVPDSVPWVPAANYNLGDIWMVDADLGYASAFYGIGGLPMGGAFLVTTDGGNTWDWDASGSTGSGYMGLDGEKKAHGAAGGVGLSNATWQGGANSGPTADAGEDGTGVVGEPFVLDGTGSADPEGDTLMHKWTLLSGPDLELVTPFGETLDVVPQTAGTYEFELLVSDSEFTDTDTVTFTIDDEPVTDDDDDDAADDDDDDGDDDGGDDDSDDDEASGGCGC
ncbi:MAG: PKD domain-containing protein [Deltaproteobacteria bacterium]|nr:PKD domain-containing protein [Deltaproteobacteria bacterium]